MRQLFAACVSVCFCSGLTRNRITSSFRSAFGFLRFELGQHPSPKSKSPCIGPEDILLREGCATSFLDNRCAWAIFAESLFGPKCHASSNQ